MDEENDNVNNSKKSETGKQSPSAKEINVGRTLHSILDGTILTRDNMIKSLPFLFFVTGLLVIYIGNTYYSERKIRRIDEVKKDLKELRYEYITAKSELMNYSRQSEIAKRLFETGVKESTVPPIKIFINEQQDKK